MDKYTELYAWIWKVFGEEDFSIDQFRSTFATSQGPKVAHDLVKRGYLSKVGRGIYRTVEPREFVEKVAESEVEFALLEKAGKAYAFCDSTAVSIWTDGYYWTGFTKGFKPIHVGVRKKDLAFWESFFKRLGVKCTLEGKSRTLYGQVHVLHPRRTLAFAEKDGLKVVPREEVVSFCLKHELIYAPALEYLDEKYGVGYRRREQARV